MSTSTARKDYVRTFNRFELKYLVHYTQARALFEVIGTHVDHDPHAGRDGFYKIASLYYDTPDLTCYWEKMDGEKYRRKVRVRTYGECPAEGFVEIKQRYNLNVQKRRCRFPLEVIDREMDLIRGGPYPGGTDPVLDEVFNMVRQRALEPKLIISYNRAAFFDRYRPDLRITLDRNIKCRAQSLRVARDRLKGRYVIQPTMMILEVKFNEAIPRWLCTSLNRLDLQVQRFSKYCAGIECTDMHLRAPRRLRQPYRKRQEACNGGH